ncbi:MAG: hypothetical protein R3F02_19860 [Thiolinea sp.]
MLKRFLLFIFLGLSAQTALAFPITSYLEMLKVSAVGYAWKPVPLENTYTNPVIACTYNLSSAVENEAVVRVRPAAGGFEVLIQQPLNNSTVTPGDVYCTVSEAGVYTYPIKYEAHTVSSAQTNYSGQWSSSLMEDVSASPYKQLSYNKPVVTGQVMSFNNPEFSVFWSNNCGSRSALPTNTGICVGKHSGEIIATHPNAETLGYFIAEEAEYFMANAYVNIALGTNSVSGVGNNPPYNYTLPQNFSFATATQSAENGGNGGWAVLYGNTPVSNVLQLAIDEETFTGDASRSHVKETVAYWVSEPITKAIADLTINEILYRQTSGQAEFVELYVQSSGTIANYVLAGQDGLTQTLILPDFDVTAGDYIIFYFSSGTDSSAGNVHTFYFSSGTDSSAGNVHTFYAGGSPALENTGDDIVLLKPSATDVTILPDASGTVNAIPVDYVAYGAIGAASTDPPPVSLDGVTVNWNPADATRLLGAASGQSISLTPNAVDSDSSICWELTGSGHAAACPGYLITAVTNPSTFAHSAGENNNISPLLTLEKTVQTLYDPVNTTFNPKAIPGSILEYTIIAYNGGNAAADNNSIVISDLIPANTRLCVSNHGYCAPAYFVDGSPSSGLSGGAPAYSGDGGNSYGYLPVADSHGTDAAVTHISIPTSGAFQPASGGLASNFSVKFRVLVE